jgi:hypothetical protein
MLVQSTLPARNLGHHVLALQEKKEGRAGGEREEKSHLNISYRLSICQHLVHERHRVRAALQRERLRGITCRRGVTAAHGMRYKG